MRKEIVTRHKLVRCIVSGIVLSLGEMQGHWSLETVRRLQVRAAPMLLWLSPPTLQSAYSGLRDSSGRYSSQGINTRVKFNNIR